MSTDLPGTDDLFDVPLAPDRRPPRLIPGAWQAFLAALIVLDLGCLVVGYVPWTGGPAGMHRGDVVVALVVGLGLGLAVGLWTVAAASRRFAEMGLTDDEAALMEDERSLLAGPQRTTGLGGWLGAAVLFLGSGLFAWLLFASARHLPAHAFILLNAVGGLALPILWRRHRWAQAAFLSWLDEKSAPLDKVAAQRAAYHRRRLADTRAKLEAAERDRRERLERVPRVPPPPYLAPAALWAPLALAVLLDLLLLLLPGLREASPALAGGPGRLFGRMIVLWLWGVVAAEILWAALSWYYVEISDQVSRQWSARDWRASFSAIALEVALGLIALALLAGLVGGWAWRFTWWNVAAPSFLLAGVLRDIRRTARDYYARSLEKGPTAAAHDEEEEI